MRNKIAAIVLVTVVVCIGLFIMVDNALVEASATVARAPEEEWNVSLGMCGTAYSVQQTSDGGYILAGIEKGHFDTDILLVKTDMEGNVQWKKTFEGLCFPFHSYLVQQTSDGGYIVAGRAGWLIKLKGTAEKAMKAEFLSPSIDFSVLKDSNVPLKLKVTYEGEPTTGASLTASFSNGDPDVKLTEGENGIYTGTWTPTNIIEGQVESPIEITIEAYHGTLGRVYAK